MVSDHGLSERNRLIIVLCLNMLAFHGSLDGLLELLITEIFQIRVLILAVSLHLHFQIIYFEYYLFFEI